MGKIPDATSEVVPDLRVLPSAAIGFGKPESRFFAGFRAPGRLIHSSTPNDYGDYLLSIFKT
jgi:hypothetical protein